MCRFAGWVSVEPATAESTFGTAAIDRLAYLSTVHCHGWGAAWLDPSDRLMTTRSELPAHTDPDFLRFVHHTSARAAFVHLRLGTPGYGGGAVNSHPFQDERWAFAHNGAIGPKELIDRLIPPGEERAIRGQTDSERYFAALRAEVGAARGSAAVASGAARVVERMQEIGLTATSMNGMLMDRDQLHVLSLHDPTIPLGPTPVWPTDDQASSISWPGYLPINVRQDAHHAAFSSSGIIDDPTSHGWTLLPNKTVWTLGIASGSVEISTIDAAAEIGHVAASRT